MFDSNEVNKVHNTSFIFISTSLNFSGNYVISNNNNIYLTVIGFSPGGSRF